MLAYHAARWNLDPDGTALHVSSGLRLNVISGHRNANLSVAACGGTECPGNGLYTPLPDIRQQVAQQVAGTCPIAIPERMRCVASSGKDFLEPVAAPPVCVWQSGAAASWISVSSTTGGARINVDPNTGSRRTADVVIGRHAITLVQASPDEGTLPCPRLIASAGNDSTRPVVAGSLVSVYGSNFATQEALASPGSTSTQLAGVSMTIDGRAAPLLYVGPNQVNADPSRDQHR